MASSSSHSKSRSSPKILFVVLRGELISIDFEKLLLQHESNRLIHHGPIPGAAPIHFRMNLLDKKGIVGLKHATLGSKVYLLGGERLRSGAIPTISYLSNHRDSYIGSSRRVFHLHRKNNTFSLESTDNIKQLQYPKGSPMVAQIEGKIYVLQGKPYLHDIDPTHGTFEVYHEDSKYWEILCDPPPYSSKGEIFGHFVLGHKLFILEPAPTQSKIYLFDTRSRSRRWEQAPDVVSSFKQTHLSPPTNGMCVPFFPQLNNDQFQLMLSRDLKEEAVYALVMHSSTGRLLFYQPLKEVFSGLHPLTETGSRVQLSMQSHFFFMLPNNEICAIWAGSDQHERLRLFISIFALELRLKSVMKFWPVDAGTSLPPSPPIEKRFVEVHIIRKHDCTVTTEKAFPNYVNDAFLL